MNEVGAENLVQGIVKRATSDWIQATNTLKKDNSNITAKRTIIECERFFDSDWFYLLTGVDGKYFIKTLKVKYEK